MTAAPAADLPRDVPPLQGREPELQRALDEVGRAGAERRLLALLVRGAEGSGKSRLVHELLERLGPEARSRVARVAFSPGEAPPGHGLAALARQLLGLHEHYQGAGLREALGAALAALPSLGEPGQDALRFEFLAFALGVAEPGFRTARTDVRSRWEGAFTELKRLMERHAAGGPWVCVIEDAERGDLQTADFVDWALPLRWTAPVVLLLSLRPDGEAPVPGSWGERVARWSRAPAVVDLPLAPLAGAPLRELVAALGGGALAPALVQRLADHARGSPLLARELVRLAQEGALGEALPGTLGEALGLQLDRLPADARELARRAAVVGPRVPLEALQRLWEGAPQALAAGLEVLVARGVLTPEPSLLAPGTPDLVFVRAPQHEAALARVGAAERGAWLRVLEAWAQERLDGRDAAAWGPAEVQLAAVLVRVLDGRGAAAEASLWRELLARVHLRHQRRAEALAALRVAAEAAVGVRRAVLLRRVGEEETLAGDTQRALATLSARAAAHTPVPAEALAAGGPGARALALVDDPLERWDVLGAGDAAACTELARAEVLSHVGRSEETASAFTALEGRLAAVRGPAAAALWARWARTWSWFLAELLGRPRDALRVCEQVRARADVRAAGLDRTSEPLLRAEQVAASRTGDLARARLLADQQLTLAQERGDLTAEVVVWNARGILHLSVGELTSARDAFDTSARMARSVGYRRREAIALHNLGITLLEQGDTAGARAAQTRYMDVSRDIGNRPASAYGPASLAAVALAERAFADVERHLTEARTVAEESRWPFILAWARGLTGQARLLRWVKERDGILLKQAKGDLLACLDALEERGSGWTEELDPGEMYLAHALSERLLGSDAAARAALAQGRKLVAPSCAVSHAWLDVGEALLAGRPLEPVLAWFNGRGYVRAVRFVDELRAALG